MEPLRLSDVVSLPGFMSLVRVPLAVAFPFALHAGGPAAGFAVLMAAGISDVLDGWFARRAGRATTTGAVLDPIMDKVFVVTVAVTLLVTRRLSVASLVFLGARDLLEVPLALWWAFAPDAHFERSGHVRANIFGKTATVFQFATISASLFDSPITHVLALGAGASGIVAAATYWARAFDRNHPAPGGRGRPGAGLPGAGVRRAAE
jgi:CDP-diacylglycerol--glycerol-3-phosphate 3-phosphatidyltransferase/cardiolipin synthase